jgi:hypothetical protein
VSEAASARAWIEWTEEVAERRPDIRRAVETFQPVPIEAGQAAARWLKEHSLHPGSKTYMVFVDGRLQGFYAVTMGEALLRSSHQKDLGVEHPRQGAVIITWLAKANDAVITGEELLLHAVGTARQAAHYVDAQVLALDPFDEATAEVWRKKYGFRTSLATRDAQAQGPRRLWKALFPK